MDSAPRPRRTRAALLVLLPLVAAVLVAAFTSCGGDDDGPGTASQAAGIPVAATGTAAPRLSGGGLPAGCRCHSKVKWQVAMHKLFGPQDCMQCHSQNEDLMATGSEAMTPAHLAELRQRMRDGPVCLECHEQGATDVPARFNEMKGRLYCPSDGEMYRPDQAVRRAGSYFCRDDGAKLVDVDAVTLASEKKPDNRYCIACHPQTPELREQHAGVSRAAGADDLADCLSCHPGHSDCGSCHH